MKALWTTLLSWAEAHPLLAATVLATAAASVLSSVWYAVRRAVWPGVETAKLPTWARLVQALVELLVNLPGALRALAALPSTPPGAPRPPTLPPPPAVLALLVLVLGLVLAGCPKLPPSDGCRPAETRCSRGDLDPASIPQTCSPAPGARWTGLPLAEPCSVAGAVCCLTRGRSGELLHACAPDQTLCLALDGGSQWP